MGSAQTPVRGLAAPNSVREKTASSPRGTASPLWRRTTSREATTVYSMVQMRLQWEREAQSSAMTRSSTERGSGGTSSGQPNLPVSFFHSPYSACCCLQLWLFDLKSSPVDTALPRTLLGTPASCLKGASPVSLSWLSPPLPAPPLHSTPLPSPRTLANYILNYAFSVIVSKLLSRPRACLPVLF